jgi:hypothetical protein
MLKMIRYSKERHNILTNLHFGKMTLVIFINKVHIRPQKVCIKPYDNRADPHDDKNGGDNCLL